MTIQALYTLLAYHMVSPAKTMDRAMKPSQRIICEARCKRKKRRKNIMRPHRPLNHAGECMAKMDKMHTLYNVSALCFARGVHLSAHKCPFSYPSHTFAQSLPAPTFTSCYRFIILSWIIFHAFCSFSNFCCFCCVCAELFGNIFGLQIAKNPRKPLQIFLVNMYSNRSNS